MKLWSRIAIFGAAVAALGPAVVEADDEPDQVDIPTIDLSNQTVAAATVPVASVDTDADLVEDMVPGPKPHVAALPPPGQLPTVPGERTPGPPRARPKVAGTPSGKGIAHLRSWYGGGQRYGG